MSTQQQTDVDVVKARIKATWMAGDYAQIAQFTQTAANEFIERRQLKPGSRLLDVACGNGNLSIPAARAGAIVTGIDIAPNLLAQGRSRAAAAGLKITFEEGDAENLPIETGAFDIVVSMFGVIFAPRPDIVASELCRVCRRGGQIAMANWTPTGFIGKLLRVTGTRVVPTVGVPSPLQWGDEDIVRNRFRNQISDIKMTRCRAVLKLPFPVKDAVEFYRMHYGPTQRAFESLPESSQGVLRRDLENLYSDHNEATDGTTQISAEYLEVAGTKT